VRGVCTECGGFSISTAPYVAHGQYSTWGGANHVFGDAAKQQMRNSASPVSAHHNQVDRVIDGIRAELPGRQTADDGASPAKAPFLGLREPFQQARAGVLQGAFP
jgi:hypothetical protein